MGEHRPQISPFDTVPRVRHVFGEMTRMILKHRLGGLVPLLAAVAVLTCLPVAKLSHPCRGFRLEKDVRGASHD